jgi:hypothetical protein
VYSPGDIVIAEGSYGTEMFFVEHGVLEVTFTEPNTKEQIAVAMLSRGTFFGEASLFFADRRTASVSCVDFCELFVLQKDSLDTLLTRYPFEKERMFRAVEEVFDNKLKQGRLVTANLGRRGSSRKIRNLRESTDAAKIEVKKMRGMATSNYILPRSNLRYCWDVVLFLFVLYLACSLPIRVAFARYDKYWSTEVIMWTVGDLVADMVFIMDIYLRSRLFGNMKHGKPVTTHIFRTYKREGGFYIDVIGSIPFEVVALATWQFQLIPVLRLVRLLRLRKTGTFLVSVENMFQVHHLTMISRCKDLKRVFAKHAKILPSNCPLLRICRNLGLLMQPTCCRS